MNAITRPIREHPILAFSILACLFGWILYVAAALGAAEEPSNLPLGPIIAAALVCACLGRPALRDWLRRLLHIRAPLRWYALALLAPVAIVAGAVLANHFAFGAPLPTAEQLAGWTALPAEFLGILILIGIGEEAGWTAFAAPRLLERHPFLLAWLVLASLRTFWHLPLMLSGDLPWVLGIGGNFAFQFLLLWVFLRTGQWFLAAVWHTALNTAGGSFFFQMVEGADQTRLGILMTLGYALVALAVLWLDRRRLLRPPPAGGETPIARS